MGHSLAWPRGARVNIKNASCNINVTLVRQIKESSPRPLVVPLRIPLLVIFKIVPRPHSSLRKHLVRIAQKLFKAHLYVFHPLEAFVQREIVPNRVLKLLPILDSVSRTLQNPRIPICLFLAFSTPPLPGSNSSAGFDLASAGEKTAQQFAILIKLSACNWYIYVCRKKGVNLILCSRIVAFCWEGRFYCGGDIFEFTSYKPSL